MAPARFHRWRPRTRQTDAGTEAHVWDLYLLTRTDRQSDRVEVSPEQLVEANIAAEVGPRAPVGCLVGAQLLRRSRARSRSAA